MSQKVSTLDSPLTTRFSRKNNIFYIRLTVILVMAYMLLVEPADIDDSPWSYLYIALYMGSNLLVLKLPDRFFHQSHFFYFLVAFDTLMIALGIMIIGQADSYFFIVYFLIIGISAMNRNIKYLMLNTLMFIIIYGWIMYISGQFHGEDASRYALRLPFIWSFAILLGYTIDCVVYDVNKNIRDLEERYRSLVQSIDSPIFMLDHEGRFLYVNEKTLSSMATSRDRIINRPLEEFYSPHEAYLFRSNLNKVFEENRSVQFTSCNKENDLWHLNILSPVRDVKPGSIQAVSVVSKDITENVKSERELRKAYDYLKETQDRLIQKNKMEALGRMSSGIAHQIRNPLEIILLGVEYLEELGYDKNAMDRQSIERIKKATHRVNRIVHDLLQFSRTSHFVFEKVNLHHLLEESIEFMEHRITESGIHVKTDFSTSELFVKGDKTTLQQVFLNILNNAVEAVGKKGRLSIKTYVLETQATGQKDSDHLGGEHFVPAGTDQPSVERAEAGSDIPQDPDNSWIVVEIEDNGPGISQELALKIFEPFYTTKKARQGTGLGLSIASLIIERHRGHIEAITRENQGTVFKIKLLPAG